MTQSLETALSNLCVKHGLTSMNVGVKLRENDETYYAATVWWNGFALRGIACEQGYGPTINAALAIALERMNKERAVPVEPTTLPSLADAA